MSNLLKDVYSESFYATFSTVLNQSLSTFNEAEFKKLIFCEAFSGYELKARMTHTAKILHHFLPANFSLATKALEIIITNLRAAGIEEDSFEFMFFPEYISMYGLDDYETAISALEFITQYTSCEFAVRPFLIKYETNMLEQMRLWSQHDNYWVRRLASEGSRPRLPWAMALPSFKKDPLPLLPILENLKQDSRETVRRSVANNLNDIAKDNPEFVIEIAQRWLGISKQTDALVKHACRTLLKQGNPKALSLFGFDSKKLVLDNFKIITPTVKIGGKLEFSFTVQNQDSKSRLVRLEYGLYYKKKNGSLAKKVFKISEREIATNAIHNITKKQNFKIITTRVFYTGEHELSIIINGKESDTLAFVLS